MNEKKNLWNDPLSALLWWYDLAIFALMFPSNSVLVFFRKRLGYRLMKPWVMALVFFWLMFLAYMASSLPGAGAAAPGYNQDGYNQGGYNPQAYAYGGQRSGYGMQPGASPQPSARWLLSPLAVFAVAMALLAAYRRRRGWQLIFDAADPLHSMSRGDSYLFHLLGRIRPMSFQIRRWNLPRYHIFPVSEFVVQRYIEPILCILLGVAAASRSSAYSPLGGWLVLSGFSVAAIEALVKEKTINAMLDRHDAKVEAANIAAIDKQKAEASVANTAPAAPPKIGGVTISPELQRLREQRLAGEPIRAVLADA